MRAHIAVLGLALAQAGCLIAGYGEQRGAKEEDAGPSADAQPGDLDASARGDMDAGRDGGLDARTPATQDDAQIDPPDEDDGGIPTNVEEWCATHPCGDVKQCTSPDCALSCGSDDYQVDAGRGVDCTFDCNGASTCNTACDTSLSCQTSCIGADRCKNTCKVGATCNVYCASARCGGSCESGSSCAFTCPLSGCEEVACKAGARCLLRCGGGGNTMTNNNGGSCKFSVCEADGGQQRCGGGRTVVCGRPCPTR